MHGLAIGGDGGPVQVTCWRSGDRLGVEVIAFASKRNEFENAVLARMGDCHMSMIETLQEHGVER